MAHPSESEDIERFFSAGEEEVEVGPSAEIPEVTPPPSSKEMLSILDREREMSAMVSALSHVVSSAHGTDAGPMAGTDGRLVTARSLPSKLYSPATAVPTTPSSSIISFGGRGIKRERGEVSSELTKYYRGFVEFGSSSGASSSTTAGD